MLSFTEFLEGFAVIRRICFWRNLLSFVDFLRNLLSFSKLLTFLVFLSFGDFFEEFVVICWIYVGICCHLLNYVRIYKINMWLFLDAGEASNNLWNSIPRHIPPNVQLDRCRNLWAISTSIFHTKIRINIYKIYI